MSRYVILDTEEYNNDIERLEEDLREEFDQNCFRHNEKVRALQERKEHLEECIDNCEDNETRNDLIDDLADLEDDLLEAIEEEWKDLLNDGAGEFQRLRDLKGVRDDFGSDWESTTFIREDTFDEYAREFASEISSCDMDHWPCTCIDWEQAARELYSDYSHITIDDVDYVYRS